MVDSLGLDSKAAERVRFALMQVREAMAPTNYFWTNPAAVKRCYDTGRPVRTRRTHYLTGALIPVAGGLLMM